MKKLPTLMLTLFVLASTQAGQPSTPAAPQFFQQTTYNANNASLGIGFSGSNASTHGLDYKIDGVTLNYIPPITTPPTGITYTTTTTGTGTSAVTYKVQNNQSYAADGSAIGSPTPTGVVYRQDGSAGSAQWVQMVPGAAMQKITVGQIVGSSDTSATGVNIAGTHNDNQLIGGVSNGEPNRSDALEGLIRSARDSANTFIDLSTGTVTGAGLGTAANPVVVYAKGRTQQNGTISETVLESDLHWSGQQQGFGLLVVEIDDPNQAQFVMSGQSKWTGLVVIVLNKNPTTNKQPLSFVGGGQDVHIVGGVFVYARNQKRTASETATLLGVEMVKLAGNGNIRFSDAAIDRAFKIKPSVLQVRSWRRLPD